MSTREQNPDHQVDALTRAGVDADRIYIDMAFGKLASRPNLDELMPRLEPGDQVIVTRLKRIGRNHQHLLDLSAWFEAHQTESLFSC